MYSPRPVCGSPCLTQVAVMLVGAILAHHKESITVSNCQASKGRLLVGAVGCILSIPATWRGYFAGMGTWLEFCYGTGLELSTPARPHCVHCQFRRGLRSV